MKKIIATEKAPQAIGPYSQAVRAGDFVFFSGQIPLLPESGEMVPGGIEDQVQQVLKNVQAMLDAAGLSVSDVVKTTIFLADINDFALVNGIYAELFNENPPARAVVQAAALPKGALIEMEWVAWSGK